MQSNIEDVSEASCPFTGMLLTLSANILEKIEGDPWRPPSNAFQPPWGEWPWVRSRQDNCLIKLLHAKSSEDQKQANLAKCRWSICQKNEYLKILQLWELEAGNSTNASAWRRSFSQTRTEISRDWFISSAILHFNAACLMGIHIHGISMYFIVFHGFYEVLLRVFWCCVLRALLQGRWTIEMEDTKEVVSVRPASKRHLIDGCEAFFPSYLGWRSYFQGVEPHQICDGIPYVFSSASISISFSMYIYIYTAQ